MVDFEVYDVAVLPVIVALVSLSKTLGVPSKIAPLVAVAFGILAGVVYISPDDVAQGVYVGLTVGLGGKRFIQRNKDGCF